MKKPKSTQALLLSKLRKFVQNHSNFPWTFQQIMKELRIPKSYTKKVQKALDILLSQNLIHIKEDGIYPTDQSDVHPVVEGKVSLHPRGFAFVSVEGEERDIFIPKPYTNSAVDKDLVEVVIDNKTSSKGPEGKIVRILERARSKMVCVIEERHETHSYYAFSPLLGIEKELIVCVKNPKTLRRGDRVVVSISRWGRGEKPTLATYEKTLGTIHKAATDIDCALIEYTLSGRFPKEVEKEAAQFGSSVPKQMDPQRTDLTHLTTFTIDPTTARDFDDALSIEKNSDGSYHLGVHIADVSHYVRPHTKLDEEAYERGNSTYFPQQCIPMLPEALSNNLCSLKEGVERFTVSILMKLDPNGHVQTYEITKGKICSQKRFTYEEAKEVLDGKKQSHLLPQLQELCHLCHQFKKLRRERGSVDLSLPEIKINVNAKGEATGFSRIEYDITHQLVEECMLKANELVAKHLKEKLPSSIYRIHDAPTAEQMKDLQQLATLFGFKIPSDPSQQDLQQLFDEAKDSPLLYQLSTAYIRSMKLAIYSTENIGHYGLALDHYTHFTSPIRRYTDLVIHRLLFDEQDLSSLKTIADHCSETERNSFRAEMSVIQMKKLRLLKSLYQQNPKAIYPAVITKIKPQGFHFELANLLTDGFLHISQLYSDYFVYMQETKRLVGSKTQVHYHVGKEIKLKMQSVDLILQEVEWILI